MANVKNATNAPLHFSIPVEVEVDGKKKVQSDSFHLFPESSEGDTGAELSSEQFNSDVVKGLINRKLLVEVVESVPVVPEQPSEEIEEKEE